MTVAVLALQGAFAEHENVLKRLGVDCIEPVSYTSLRAHDTASSILSRLLLYTSPSPRDRQKSRMPSSA